MSKDDAAPPFEEAADTDVVELSGADIVATEIVPVNAPSGVPRPSAAKHPRTLRMNDAPAPPQTQRMNDLPPPRTLRMNANAARHGTTKPGVGKSPSFAEIVDEDSFSGRETATYQRVSVEPAPAAKPLQKTIALAASPVASPPPPQVQPVLRAVPNAPVPAALAPMPTPPPMQMPAPVPMPAPMQMPPGPMAMSPAGRPSAADDGILPAPFSAPRSELPALPRKRWVGTTIVGVAVGLLVVLGAFGAPRLWKRFRPSVSDAPVASTSPSETAASPAGQVASVDTNATASVSSNAVASASAASPSPEAPASAAASQAAVASAEVPPATPSGSMCSGDRTLPPEICAYADAIRAGQDPPRPALATFQRFLLERDITRIRGRVLSQREAGTFAITLSGSFGYCLVSAAPLEIGSLYLGWAERLPSDETCARFRAVTFPDTIDRLFAAGDPAERRRLADVLAGEIAQQLQPSR